MKIIKLCVVFIILASGFTYSQTTVKTSVFSNGGAVLTGQNYSLTGTVGQPVIGETSNSSTIHSIGFWNQISSIVTGIHETENNAVPTVFRLDQNYPNPFNPVTTIRFALPQYSQVSLKIYNMAGAEEISLVNKVFEAGEYEINFDARNLPSGVYFYRLITEEFVQTRKLLLLK